MTKETREKDKKIFEISLKIILIHPQLPSYTISNKKISSRKNEQSRYRLSYRSLE